MARTNPETRREALVRAVWTVIRRQGLDRASVRAVAAEADLSMGSLRHYFNSQTELRKFAMRTVMERVEQRIAALELPTDPRESAELTLMQLLPLDEERQLENDVWLAFTAGALTDRDLRRLRDESYDKLRDGCHHWVQRLAPRLSKVDRELEGDRLFGLLDGLAVHAAMRPDESTPDRLRQLLTHHLDQLVLNQASGQADLKGSTG